SESRFTFHVSRSTAPDSDHIVPPVHPRDPAGGNPGGGVGLGDEGRAGDLVARAERGAVVDRTIEPAAVRVERLPEGGGRKAEGGRRLLVGKRGLRGGAGGAETD